MHTKLVPDRPLTIVVAALAAGSLLFGQEEETSTTRLLKSSEADQIAYLNDYIAEGMTTPTDDAQILVLNKPSLFAPMLEQKVEEILHSRPPERWFKNPSANPERVVDLLAAMIAYRGEGIALQQASKLMKIDEHRFGSMVTSCLQYAFSYRKGFQLAYRGLEIGDPAVDKRIMAWVDAGIGERVEPNHTITLRQWAEAVVEEYKGAPDEYQWAKDPIVSRLSADLLNPPGGTPLHDEMFRLIAEAVQKRQKK
jgi:hypothetical protein